MKKALLFFLLSTLVASFCNAQSTTTNNTLNSTGVTGIQSSAVTGYKLSVGGTVKLYGTGLSSSSSPSFYLRNTTASTGRNYYINSSDGGLFQVVDSNASNAIRMVINSSGYLGINTTSPAYHLDVNGSIKTASNIYLPTSTSSIGVVFSGSSRLLHTVGTNSVFLGQSAGTLTNTATNSTAVGVYALTSITTGNNNSAFGEEALYANTSGAYNTALGQGTLRSNSTGNYNTAIGAQALYSNTTGNDNTAIGEAALGNTNTGSDNIAIGTDVMALNTSGSRNTAVGRVALFSNLSGNDNTAMGMYALRLSTTSNNTAIGDSAGASVTTGASNSFLGKSSGASIQTGSNNSFFGSGIYNPGTSNYSGSSNTAIGSNITGMGNGSYNTVIGAGVSVPAVSNNIIVADGQGNQRIRIFNNGNTLIGYTSYADSGYKLDVSGSLRNTGGVRFQGLTTNNALTNILAADASGNLSWRDASSLGAGVVNPNNWSITGNTAINPATQFIGTTDAQPVVFKTSNSERGRVTSTGNFLLGSTADAGYKLDVTGNSRIINSPNTGSLVQSDLSDYSKPALEVRDNLGGTNYNTPLQVTSPNLSSGKFIYMSVGKAISNRNSMLVGFNWDSNSSENNRGILGFPFAPNAIEWYPDQRVKMAGRVMIGAATDDGVTALQVNGTIHTKKVKVDMTGWSDYVFDNDYRLRTLAEVQEFIAKNNHLPDVPSTEEVKKNGIDLGENQSVLLRKIEELTLYAIGQDKTIEEQNKKLDQLQNQIDELKKLILKK